MEIDTKEPAAATPAADGSADNKADTAKPAPESAPETKEANISTSEQVKTGNDKTGKDGLPGGVKKRLWEQSEKIRKMESELAVIRAKKETNTNTETAPAKTETDVTLLDDPEKWASTLEKNVLTRAEEKIFSRLEQVAADKKRVKEAEEAQKFLLSKSDFGTEDSPNEEALTEIQAIVASEDVQAICAKSPMKGAEYAFYLWQKAKGLDASSVATAKSNAAKSAAPIPSGNANAGKKTWTPKEVEAYLSDYKSADFTKRRDEILLAQREGRIKAK